MKEEDIQKLDKSKTMRKILLSTLSLSFLILLSCVNRDNYLSDSNNVYRMDSTLYLKNNSEYKVDSIKVVSLKELKSNNLYSKHCKFCHGSYGKGNGIKARTDSTLCPFDLSKEYKPDNKVYYIILNGKNRMPDQKELSDDQIWLLILYIKKFR